MCNKVKKVRMATMKPTNDDQSNVAIATDVTVSGSSSGTGKSKTNLILTGTPSALRSTNGNNKMTTLQGNTNRGSAATKGANGAVTEVNKAKTGKEMIVTGTIGRDSNKPGVTKSRKGITWNQ